MRLDFVVDIKLYEHSIDSLYHRGIYIRTPFGLFMVSNRRVISGMDIKDISDLARIDWDAIFGEQVVAIETKREDVGLDVEPRMIIYYEIIRNDSSVSKNNILLIFQKDGATVASAYIR